MRRALADIQKRQRRPKVDVERHSDIAATAGSSTQDLQELAEFSADDQDFELVVESALGPNRRSLCSFCDCGGFEVWG